ncbi:MAG: restriction endonuclease [Candidatus Omnitrophica bacterium]|nr:restriction endonuclease [Candidatus Omnitrophota bacterium]
MNNYDFAQLNDKEFETLAADLLSAYLGIRIERFKPGKDKGVDGRFFSNGGKETIVQCKHYLKTGYSGLISKLKNIEKTKVSILSPARYILVTSLPLSRENKKEIYSIFYPHIKIENDIYGQEDLNGLLSQHQEIEEKHFKLWISSTVVLREFMNKAILGRSRHEFEQIERKALKYVQTENHNKALKLLKENNVLIISGEPGIGKTTLAENLCLYFMSKGYEFIDIEESLSEAEAIFSKEKKQIFYFDDFLGSNYFEAVENKKDSHIVKFIDRVHADDLKLFILTSRTNILNNGISYSSIFANSKLRKNEFLLTIEGLCKMDKAKILYNHIWHSKLSESFIDEIYKDKRYQGIIAHHNFNPRLIEFITDIERITVEKPADYWKYIQATLNNPKDIWDLCFKKQNNQSVRALVLLTVFNGGSIKEEALRLSFSRMKNLGAITSQTNVANDFSSVASLATSSFLNRTQSQDGFFYSLFNPSIADYVLAEYIKDIDDLIVIFKSLESIRSLESIMSFEKGGMISSTELLKLKLAIFDDALIQNKSYDYLIVIAYFLKDNSSKTNKIISILNRIISCPLEIKELSKFLELIIQFKNDLKIVSYDFLFKLIGEKYLLGDLEIEQLAFFIEKYSIQDEVMLSKLKEYFDSYLASALDTEIASLDPSDYNDVSQIGPDDYEVGIDYNKLSDRISTIGNSLIDDFPLSVIDSLGIDIKDIIKSVDLDEVVSSFDEGHDPDWGYDGYSGGGEAMEDPVDDLFERT